MSDEHCPRCGSTNFDQYSDENRTRYCLDCGICFNGGERVDRPTIDGAFLIPEGIATAIAATPPPLCIVVKVKHPMSREQRERLRADWMQCWEGVKDRPPVLIVGPDVEIEAVRDPEVTKRLELE